MFGQDDPVRLAIEAKQTERNQLAEEIEEMEKELETKRTRLGWLDAFIEKGNLLLGIESKPTKTENLPEIDFLAALDDKGPIEKPHIKGAEEILRKSGRAMKASEVAKQFYNRNWKLSRDNGPQIIRSVLKNNPDLFERLEDGSFILR